MAVHLPTIAFYLFFDLKYLFFLWFFFFDIQDLCSDYGHSVYNCHVCVDLLRGYAFYKVINVIVLSLYVYSLITFIYH